MSKQFFSRPEVQDLLRQVIARLESQPDRQHDPKFHLLAKTISIIRENAERFDEQAQVNISWIGESLLSAVAQVIANGANIEEVDRLYGLIYRITVEFDLSIKNDLSFDLRKFQNHIVENESAFTKDARESALFARQEMPISILKHLLSAEVIQNLRSLEKISKDVDQKIEGWEGRLAYQQGAATKLENSLKEYKTGFNFVGLHQGFDELSSAKKIEIASGRVWLLIFGLLAILPLTLELILLYWNRDVLNQLKWVFIASAIPAVSLTLLLIYFFRIVLRNSEAARSQLLQIELRKTLCRFIQSYAEYSKQLKENNVDALAKFESIIFSGLVSNDEKLPSTFDGMEQITNFVKAIKGDR